MSWQFAGACTRKQETEKKWRREHRCGAGEGRSGGAHLHSGSAIKREGLDLPVLQENLQHVGDEEESFLLQHVLQGKREGGEGGEEAERTAV